MDSCFIIYRKQPRDAETQTFILTFKEGEEPWRLFHQVGEWVNHPSIDFDLDDAAKMNKTILGVLND